MNSSIVPGVRPGIRRRLASHPPGLFVLAMTEMWERFSFSGMQTLLVLYMVQDLLTPARVGRIAGFAPLRAFLESIYGALGPQPLASAIFGLYTGLIFFMPVIGGYVGDRLIGQHRTVLLGAVLMTIGHFLMAFDVTFIVALAALILGAGCIKGNISTQVAGLYADDDRRRADGFQIFSAGINLGVVVAPLVCGTLGEVFGWHYGFVAAGAGMLIGLAIYCAGRRHLPADTKRAVREPASSLLPEKPALLWILLLCFVLTTCFLTAAGQLGNAYSLWIQAHVARGIGGYTVPVTWFQTLTPLASIAATPALLSVWRRQAARNAEPRLQQKMGIGLLLTAAGLGLLALIAAMAARGAVPGILLVPTHILVALGYLFTWPVALALFSQAAPPHARAMYIGAFFISSFIASNLVGWLGGFYMTVTPALFWGAHASIALAGALLVIATARPMRRLLLSTSTMQGRSA